MNLTYIVLGVLIICTIGILFSNGLILYGWLKNDREYLIDRELELFNRSYNARELVLKVRAISVSAGTLAGFIYFMI